MSGMPLTVCRRERLPHSDACKQCTEKLGVIEASYASAIMACLAPCRLIAQFRGPWKLAWLQRPLPGLAAKLITACRKPAINVKDP